MEHFYYTVIYQVLKASINHTKKSDNPETPKGKNNKAPQPPTTTYTP
jgi:hypothetical protein